MVAVYLDTSTVLRVLFGEPQPLAGWNQWETALSNEILGVECRRALDRARLEVRATPVELRRSLARLSEIELEMQFIKVSDVVIRRAGMPLPTVVKTLDALHLTSALLVRDALLPNLLFATHDRQQGLAAQAVGFDVVGL